MRWKKTLMIFGLLFGSALFLFQGISIYGELSQKPLIFAAPAYLLVALLLSLLQYGVQMLAWSETLNAFGIELAMLKVLEGYLLSFLPRYIPGSVWGYLSRSQWFHEHSGVPYEVSLYASVMEEWAHVLTAGLLASVVATLRFHRIEALLATVLCVVLILITGLLFSGGGQLLQSLTRGQGAATVRVFPRAWFLTCVIDLVFWAIYGGAVLSVCAVLTGSTILSSENYLAILFSTTLSWLVGFVILVIPAGLGIREWSMTRFLALTLNAEPWRLGLVAILARLAIILAELILLVLGIGLHMSLLRRGKGDNIPK